MLVSCQKDQALTYFECDVIDNVQETIITGQIKGKYLKREYKLLNLL